MSNSAGNLRWGLVFVWIIALIGAFTLDRSVATWVRDRVPVDKRVHRTHLLLETVKLPGWGPFTAVIAVALAFFHRKHGQAALALAASAISIGIFYSVVKWIVGRHRPVIKVNPWGFDHFAGGVRGLWREKGLCFPSGHALLAFATAACLSILIPKMRWIFFAIATVTATERVLENSHYLSDAVAGAGFGFLIGWLVTRAIMRCGIYDVSFGLHKPDMVKK